jgi:RNA binding exosome subunit
MTVFHNARLRAYSHATEDQSRVESAVRFASGTQTVDTEMLKGHHGNPLVKITVFLNQKRDLESLLDRLGNAGILAELLETLDRRVDHESFLHIRLSKQAAYRERIVMTEGDDAISVVAKVKAYPANRDVALRVLTEALREWSVAPDQ